MVDGWAGVFAEHLLLWWRGVVVWVGGEDYVPFVVDVVEFWGPSGRRCVSEWLYM